MLCYYLMRTSDSKRKAIAKYRAKNTKKILAWAKAWRDRNKEKVKESSRKSYWRHREKRLVGMRASHHKYQVRQYGLTTEDYARLFEDQKGCCAICKKKPKKIRLNVDHDHKTKQVRGLLCASCNRALGWFRDSQDLCLRGAKYLADAFARKVKK